MADRDTKSGKFVAGNQASVGHGRPPNTSSIPDLLRKIGSEEVEFEGQSVSKLELVIRRIFNKAIKEGHPQSVSFIANYTEGKPHEFLHHEIEQSKPVRVLQLPSESELEEADSGADGDSDS